MGAAIVQEALGEQIMIWRRITSMAASSFIPHIV